MHPVFYFYIMSNLFFLTALCLVCCTTNINAQWISKEDMEATRDFFADLRQNNPALSDTNIVVINTLFWNEVISLHWDAIIANTDFLSYDQVNEIRHKMEISRKYKFDKTILGNCRLISQKKFHAILKNKGFKAFWATFPKGYNKFSLPVFFANYTMCICYWGNFCGSYCGHQNTTIYKKEETGWRELKGIHETRK